MTVLKGADEYHWPLVRYTATWIVQLVKIFMDEHIHVFFHNHVLDIKIPSWKSSLSTRSITVGGGTTVEDFKLSEPGFSTAKPEKKRAEYVLKLNTYV